MFLRVFVVVLVSITMAGCASNRVNVKKERGDLSEPIVNSVQQNNKVAEIVAKRIEELKVIETKKLEAVKKIQEQNNQIAKSKANRKRSYHADGSSAKKFFRALALTSGVNIAVHPNVQGTITLDLDDVTVTDVLEIMSDIYGYGYKRTKAGFIVTPASRHTRIYEVDYLNVVRHGNSSVDIAAGHISNINSGGTDTDDETDFSEENAYRESEINKITPKVNIVETHQKSKFWYDLNNTLSVLLDLDGGDRFSINPDSGLVAVSALNAQHDNVESFLNKLTGRITKQVIIEAKIIEVELNKGNKSGINWTVIGKGSNNGQFGLSQNWEGGVTDAQVGELTDRVKFNPVNLLPTALSTSPFGGIISGLLAFDNFATFFEFLETQGTAHVLSSPRVSALNNQKAVIKVGQDEYFVTDFSQTTTPTEGDPIISVDPEITSFFSGITLDVTPQISNTNVITMHIHPKISEVSTKILSINISNNQTLALPMAYSTSRESDTIVRARSGEVVIIGGLMRTNGYDRSNHIPGTYGSGIDNITGHKDSSFSKSELVILLKPTVIEGDGNGFNDFLENTATTLGNY